MEKSLIRERIQRAKKYRPLIEIKELLLIFLFTAPYGIVVNQILVPHAIVGGGVTGVSEIVYFATHGAMPIWATSLLINAILLIIAIRTVGWKFCIRTIYGVLLLSFWFRVIPIPDIPVISDPFMAVILGGLFNGTALGLVFLNNGNTGGTDIVAMVVNRLWHVPIGRMMLMCDFMVISSAYFLPEVRSLEKVLFGLCYTFMFSMSVDWVMSRMRQSVQFLIFSRHYREIADAIMSEAHRGVTILDGEGGYTHQPTRVLAVLARKTESAQIFRIVRMIDPQAFVSQSSVTGVFGEGFESIREKA